MKIGIITFHSAHNYGAMLQTYALKLVCEKMGHKAVVIDYNPAYIQNQYKYFKITGNMKGDLCKALNLYGNVLKDKRFKEFKNRYFDLTSIDSTEEFDALLYGSDQIWNPNISGDFDPFFFGKNDLKTKRNIAYAASLGKQSLNEAERVKFADLISGMNAVSLREESAQKLLQPLCRREAEVTLDPTLLTLKNDWEKITVTPKFKRPYILVYEVNIIPQTMKTAEALSEKTGLPIVRIMYSRTRLFYNYKTLNGVGPKEFIGWIKNADFVVTSSFHGTAFSIIFEKNFYTVPHSSYSSRMVDLLNKLNLSNRLAETLPTEITDINYENVNKLLNSEREKSLCFIKKSIVTNKEGLL